MPIAIAEKVIVMTLEMAFMKRKECMSGSWDMMN